MAVHCRQIDNGYLSELLNDSLSEIGIMYRAMISNYKCLNSSAITCRLLEAAVAIAKAEIHVAVLEAWGNGP